jgi:rhodanese-related sulfurtransferase
MKMKKVVLFLSIGILFVLVTSGVSIAQTGYHDIDATSLKALMDKEEALVVFPLSPMEFDHKHIKGSINIIPAKMEYELPADKRKTIVFYCLGVKCVASRRAAEKAVDLGYKNVYAFREGLSGWEKAGYPLESTNRLPDVEIKKVSTDELSRLLDTEDVILLDINLNEDANKFHINHSKRKHIPLNDLNVSLPQLPKDKKIVIMCLKGTRSETAARYLIGKGYMHVFVVEGGLQQWILDGRPVQQEVASN